MKCALLEEVSHVAAYRNRAWHKHRWTLMRVILP